MPPLLFHRLLPVAWGFAAAGVTFYVSFGLAVGLSMAGHGCGGGACAPPATAAIEPYAMGAVFLGILLAVAAALLAAFLPRLAGGALYVAAAVVPVALLVAAASVMGARALLLAPIALLLGLLIAGAGHQARRLTRGCGTVPPAVLLAAAAYAAGAIAWRPYLSLADALLRPDMPLLPGLLAAFAYVVLLAAAVPAWRSPREPRLGGGLLLLAGAVFPAAFLVAMVASQGDALARTVEREGLLEATLRTAAPGLFLAAAGIAALLTPRRRREVAQGPAS